MITPERFYGGANVFTVDQNVNLVPDKGRVKIMNVTVPDILLVLPFVKEPVHAGGPIFKLINVGVEPATVIDRRGSHVGIVNTGQACLVILSRAETNIGTWHMACLPAYRGGETTTTTSTTTPTSTPGSTTDRCTGLLLIDECPPWQTGLTPPTTTDSSCTITFAQLFGEFHRPIPISIAGQPSIAEGI